MTRRQCKDRRKNFIPDYEQEEHWLRSYWRPAIAWMYLIVCAFDFLLFPFITMWWAHHTDTVWDRWKPITMEEGGMFHLAMGAIVGVTAYTRGKYNLLRARMLHYDKYNTDEDDSELDPHHIEGDEDTPEPPIHPSHEGE